MFDVLINIEVLERNSELFYEEGVFFTQSKMSFDNSYLSSCSNYEIKESVNNIRNAYEEILLSYYRNVELIKNYIADFMSLENVMLNNGILENLSPSSSKVDSKAMERILKADMEADVFLRLSDSERIAFLDSMLDKFKKKLAFTDKDELGNKLYDRLFDAIMVGYQNNPRDSFKFFNALINSKGSIGLTDFVPIYSKLYSSAFYHPTFNLVVILPDDDSLYGQGVTIHEFSHLLFAKAYNPIEPTYIQQNILNYLSEGEGRKNLMTIAEDAKLKVNSYWESIWKELDSKYGNYWDYISKRVQEHDISTKIERDKMEDAFIKIGLADKFDQIVVESQELVRIEAASEYNYLKDELSNVMPEKTGVHWESAVVGDLFYGVNTDTNGNDIIYGGGHSQAYFNNHQSQKKCLSYNEQQASLAVMRLFFPERYEEFTRYMPKEWVTAMDYTFNAMTGLD